MGCTSTFQLMSSGNHRPSERETILSAASEPPKSCGFLSIARELRDMIYSELIASGNIAILRVSKQVHDEAKDRLYKQGICRLRFCYNDSSDRVDALNPPDSPLDDVQNFNLKIYMGRHLDLHFLDRAGRTNPDLQPCIQGSGSCHVTLVFNSVYEFSTPDPVFRFIKSLGTFKLVTVRTRFIYIYHPLDRRNRDIVEPRYKTMLEEMSTILRKSLGDPESKSETCHGLRYNMRLKSPLSPFPTARYLEFHPPRAGMS